MQILKIVLYSFDGRTREIDFRLGAVNIITGESHTGKTAVATIVRYCLGREDFRVPAGVIRKKVSWFGMLLQMRETQLFIARPNPGPTRSSNTEVYYELGNDLAVPPLESLRPITNTDGLTRLLTQRVGIGDNLFEPDEGQTRTPLSANIKHAFTYNFQAQNEIASQDYLFHRQAETFIAQAVKDTFPYFLGAVDSDRLAMRQELKQEKARLKRARQQLSELSSLQADGLARGRSLLAEAADVGLAAVPASDSSLEEALTRLQEVLLWEPGLPQASPDRSALDALEERRAVLNQQFNLLQFDLENIQGLRREQAAFGGEVVEQRARLRSLRLLPAPDGEASCPVCASPVEDKIPAQQELEGSLRRLEGHLLTVADEEPKLQRHEQDLKEKMAAIRAELAEVRAAERAIVEANDRAARPDDITDRQLLVKGRVSLYLESVRPGGDRAALEAEAEETAKRVEELERALSNEDVRSSMTSMLNSMAKYMTDWAQRLQLAHSETNVRIDPDRMTVVADTPDGGITLQNMGSAGNWVGYHLVAYLGLHRWFVERNRPVPHFLVIDQPTQAYYPPEKSWSGRLKDLRDEDSAAVRRMFNLLFDVVAELAPGFQVIVIDHADIDDPRFEAAIQGRWRDGEKLVPTEWPDAS
jgi:hypothetical protein